MARIILPDFGVGPIDPLRYVPESRTEFLTGRQLAQTGSQLGDVMAQSFGVNRRLAEEADAQTEMEERAQEKFRIEGQQLEAGRADAAMAEQSSAAMIALEKSFTANPENPEAGLPDFERTVGEIGPTNKKYLDPETLAEVDIARRKNATQLKLSATTAVENAKQSLNAQRAAEKKRLEEKLYNQSLQTEAIRGQTEMNRLAMEAQTEIEKDPSRREEIVANYNEQADLIVDSMDPFHQEEMRARFDDDRNRFYRGVSQQLHAATIQDAHAANSKMLEQGLESIRTIGDSRMTQNWAYRLENEYELSQNALVANEIITVDQRDANVRAAQNDIAMTLFDTLYQKDPDAARLYVATRADLPEAGRMQLLEQIDTKIRQMGSEALRNEVNSMENKLDAGMPVVTYNNWMIENKKRLEIEAKAGKITPEAWNDQQQILSSSMAKVSEAQVNMAAFMNSRQMGAPYDAATMDTSAALVLPQELMAAHQSLPPNAGMEQANAAYEEVFKYIGGEMQHLPDKVESTFRDIYLSASPQEKQALGIFVYNQTHGPNAKHGFFGSVPSKTIKTMEEVGRLSIRKPYLDPHQILEEAERSNRTVAEMTDEEKDIDHKATLLMGPARDTILAALSERQISQQQGTTRNPFELFGLEGFIAPDIADIAPGVDPRLYPKSVVNYYARDVIEDAQEGIAYMVASGQSPDLESATADYFKNLLDGPSPAGITFMSGGVGGVESQSFEKMVGPIPLMTVKLPKGALGEAMKQNAARQPVTGPPLIETAKTYVTGTPHYERSLQVFSEKYVLQTKVTEPTAEGAPGVLTPKVFLRGEPPVDGWPGWFAKFNPLDQPLEAQDWEDLQGKLSFTVMEERKYQKPVLDAQDKPVIINGVPQTRTLRYWILAPYIKGQVSQDIVDASTVPLPDGAGGYQDNVAGGQSAYTNQYALNDRGGRATIVITEEDLGLEGARDLAEIQRLKGSATSDVTGWMFHRLMENAPEPKRVPYL